MENHFVAGMSHARSYADCETPDQPAAYWKSHIATHLTSILNVNIWYHLQHASRVKGHYLVFIGTMDTILCQPSETPLKSLSSKLRSPLKMEWFQALSQLKTLSAMPG
jgi:hypothetical protein